MLLCRQKVLFLANYTINLQLEAPLLPFFFLRAFRGAAIAKKMIIELMFWHGRHGLLGALP